METNMRYYVNIKLVFLIFMSLILLGGCTSIEKSKFTIRNESNETLLKVSVYVGNKHFLLKQIRPGVSVSKTFISFDSTYKIVAHFSQVDWKYDIKYFLK